MSEFQEFFAASAQDHLHAKILTGRDGLRAFLRLHQNTSKAPYLHYRQVNDLMIAGHQLIGIFNRAGKIVGTGAVLFGDRPMPYNAHIRNDFVRTRCAVLAFKGFAGGYHFAQNPLHKSACKIAAKNHRAYVVDGKAMWNSGTEEKVENSGPYLVFSEPKPILNVGQALTA